jgi:hypothetical protein
VLTCVCHWYFRKEKEKQQSWRQRDRRWSDARASRITDERSLCHSSSVHNPHRFDAVYTFSTSSDIARGLRFTNEQISSLCSITSSSMRKLNCRVHHEEVFESVLLCDCHRQKQQDSWKMRRELWDQEHFACRLLCLVWSTVLFLKVSS